MNMAFLTGKHLSALAASLFASLLLATGSLAMVFEADERIHISNLHRIEEDLFAWGSNIIIDGVIEGDLFAAGYTITNNGHLESSGNVLGFKFHHTGKADGSLRALVNTCTIDGYVGRSVLLSGYDIVIGKTALIEQDALIAAKMIQFDGTLKGNAHLLGDDITITGIIGGDAILEGKDIAIHPPAVINGDLTYISDKEADIDITSGVTVTGEIKWELPDVTDEDRDKERSRLTATTWTISKLLAAFLFGVILLSVFRKHVDVSVGELRRRFSVATAIGFVGLIAFAISLVILIVSVASVLVGLILASGDFAPAGALVLALSTLMVPITTFVTVCGGILFYSGKIIVALLAGYFVVRLVKPRAAIVSKTQLLIGLIVLTLIFSVPIVGLLLYLLISIIGAGAIILGIRRCRPGLFAMAQNTATPPEPPQPQR